MRVERIGLGKTRGWGDAAEWTHRGVGVMVMVMVVMVLTPEKRVGRSAAGRFGARLTYHAHRRTTVGVKGWW